MLYVLTEPVLEVKRIVAGVLRSSGVVNAFKKQMYEPFLEKFLDLI